VRQVVVPRFGGPEVLTVVDKPTPSPGPAEVLVKLAFAGITYGDVYQREGTYRPGNPLKEGDAPLPIGNEGVGTVAAVGADVRDVAVGDRVAYGEQLGSYAEYVCVPAWRVMKIPEAVSSRDAAAAYGQALTAHYLAFDTAQLSAGKSCLVHAAAGGVGHLLVQFAKSRGATVIGTVGNAEKAAFVRSLGADETILYRDVDFLAAVKALTANRGVDVVYDSVGAETIERSIKATAHRGLCVLYGNTSGLVDSIAPMDLAAAGSIYFTRPRLAHHVRTREEVARRVEDIFRGLGEGSLKVQLGAEFPLDRVGDAHRRLQSRDASGRILLTLE
jgi:NADPH2:quinone reductase